LLYKLIEKRMFCAEILFSASFGNIVESNGLMMVSQVLRYLALGLESLNVKVDLDGVELTNFVLLIKNILLIEILW
jgi:hypothetical protein